MTVEEFVTQLESNLMRDLSLSITFKVIVNYIKDSIILIIEIPVDRTYISLNFDVVNISFIKSVEYSTCYDYLMSRLKQTVLSLYFN